MNILCTLKKERRKGRGGRREQRREEGGGRQPEERRGREKRQAGRRKEKGRRKGDFFLFFLCGLFSASHTAVSAVMALEVFAHGPSRPLSATTVDSIWVSRRALLFSWLLLPKGEARPSQQCPNPSTDQPIMFKEK